MFWYGEGKPFIILTFRCNTGDQTPGAMEEDRHVRKKPIDQTPPFKKEQVTEETWGDSTYNLFRREDTMKLPTGDDLLLPLNFIQNSKLVSFR